MTRPARQSTGELTARQRTYDEANRRKREREDSCNACGAGKPAGIACFFCTSVPEDLEASV